MVQVKIEFRCNKWQRAGLIAGAMWRAAIGREYKEWLNNELTKYIYVSEPYLDA